MYFKFNITSKSKYINFKLKKSNPATSRAPTCINAIFVNILKIFIDAKIVIIEALHHFTTNLFSVCG